MPKWIGSACILAMLLPVTSGAAIRPVISLDLGSDRTNVYMTKELTLISPFQNSYIANHHFDTETVFGIFLGGEQTFLQNWGFQAGVSYFQSSSFQASGNVNQFADPSFDNFIYLYQIQSRRVMLEAKLSYAFRRIWHPYLSAGIGEAINKSYGYTETPTSTDNVSLTQPFDSHTTRSFTYAAGIGVDVDLEKHLRVGAAWRFVDLGQASLGTSPAQIGTNTFSQSHLHTNEWLLQISFID